MATNKATKKVTKKVIALVDGLKECWPDFDITINDFVNPTLASVIKFYERFVHEFGINTDTIMKILSQNCDQFDKELEDIMYVYVLYSCANHIYHLLNLTSLPSFALLSLSSFINPVDDESLVTRISLLANYLYYAEGRTQDTIIPLKNKVLEEVSALETMNVKVNMLNEHLKCASITQSKNVATLENLRKTTKILKADVRDRQKTSADLAEQILKMNAELKSLQDEKDTLTNSLENSLKKSEELKSLVVDDHETILSQYEKIQKEIKENQADSSECMVNLESKTETEASLLKNYEIVNALNKLSYLPKLLETFNSIEDNRLQKEILQSEYNMVQKIENEELKTKNELELQFSTIEGHYRQLMGRTKVRCNTYEDEIAQLNIEFEAVKQEYDLTSVQAKELNDKLKHFDACSKEYKKTIDKQCEFYEKLYKSFITTKEKLDITVYEILTKVQHAAEAGNKKLQLI